MRLQKYMALCGVASRRKAEQMILDGCVTVNGNTVYEMGFQVDESADIVTVMGKEIHPETEKHYIAYYKPIGEISSVSDPEGRATVMDKFRDYPVRLFPIGRLDYDSEGLLLLTNDGELMNNLLHPSHEVRKVYLAKVSNLVNENEIRQLQSGVMVDGKLTSPAKVVFLRKEAFASVLLITIHEGRNRQVRKMFEAVGHQVVSLKRVEFGPISLGKLPLGQWKKLTDSEIEKLKSL